MNFNNVGTLMDSASCPFPDNQLNPNRALDFVFPGAVLLVAKEGEIVYHRAFGSRSIFPDSTQAKKGLVYDVSSLTKALVTTTLIMQLVDSGMLSVDKRLSHLLPSFGSHGKERITIKHLLAHCAGYPATGAFYKNVVYRSPSGSHDSSSIISSSGSSAELVYQQVYQTKLENLPGKVAKYSDIDFMLLGHVIESAKPGTSLHEQAVKNIFAPLGLKSSGFIELSGTNSKNVQAVVEAIAPTTKCPWRDRILCGEVQDENAWAMGGVSGHAGLFTSAEDIHKIALELTNCWHGKGKLISKGTMKQFWTRANIVPGSTWALGWDTPSPQNSSAGKYFSENAVGHLGYTGCSLWIEPEKQIHVILLSNRVHPSIKNEKIRDFRPALHNAVMEALGESSVSVPVSASDSHASI